MVVVDQLPAVEAVEAVEEVLTVRPIFRHFFWEAVEEAEGQMILLPVRTLVGMVEVLYILGQIQ